MYSCASNNIIFAFDNVAQYVRCYFEMLLRLLTVLFHCAYNEFNPYFLCASICLANVFTKVVEKVLCSCMDGYLQSTFNQFGFKRKHGTEMCVFVLK